MARIVAALGFYLDSEAAGAVADLTGGSACSSRCLVRTLLSMRSLGAVGVPHSPQDLEWPIRSSIQEHLSLGLQGPNASSKLSMVGGRLRDESPRTTDDTGACPSVVSDRSYRGTGRRPVLHNPPWCSPGGTAPAG